MAATTATVNPYMSYASAGLSVLGGYMQSQAQHKQAQANLDQAYINAAMDNLAAINIMKSATMQSQMIIDDSTRVQGTQQAQQAASGVLVNNGSTAVMTDDTGRRAQADALITMYNGINQSIAKTANANFTMMAGTNSAKALDTSATTSLLSGIATGGAQMYSTYKMLKTQ
jgi:hypothetical protein